MALIDTMGSGRGAVAELAGRPRYIHQRHGANAGAYYVECLAACDTPTPIFSAPLRLGETSGEASLRPMLVASNSSTLSALWPAADGGRFVYAECGGSCDVRSSWSSASPGFGGGQTSAVGLATLGNLRAVVTQWASGGDVYSECSSGCASDAGNWTSFAFPGYQGVGASIDLAADPITGQVWRASVYGSNPSAAFSAMLYRECVGTCSTPMGWSGGGLLGGLADAGLGAGLNPAIVLDRATLPRIFYTSSPLGPLMLARCIQRPCSTDINNWRFSALFPASGYVTAGKAPDGRTFFVAIGNGEVRVGIENAAGGYDVRPIDDCGGILRGDSASGVLRVGDKWRISFAGEGNVGVYEYSEF